MARTYKVAAAHANHHGREAEGKVGELQQLLRHGRNRRLLMIEVSQSSTVNGG